MKPSVQDAVNDQIQAEFASAYIYLGMAARFDALNLKGFAHWMRLQAQEEVEHAMKFYDFLLHRGGTVVLQEIPKPEAAFDAPLAAFEEALEHERHITKRIHDLYGLAVDEHDYPLQNLLRWFVDEQVEEEESASEIVEKLRMIGTSGPTLFVLDRELGQRPV